MKIVNKAGVTIEIGEQGLLLNGKPPSSLVELGDNWWKASCVFCRVKRAKKASSQRKRKKALMVATKKYRFSFNFQQEK